MRPTGDRWASVAVFGALAGLSPDVDAPLALLGHDMWHDWHQLFTHSLVGVVWVPVLMSLLFPKIGSWRMRYGFALAGWALHVLLDVCARWPVPVPWPVSNARFAWYAIERDFSWPVDMIFVLGLAVTLWDPAQKHARPIVGAIAVLVAGWLLLGLPT